MDSLYSYINLELISSVPSHNSTFVSRNFTEAEIAYCRSQPSPPSSFAARWVGKEAVFKSLGVKSMGAAAAMKDIEIVNDESGVPTVRLYGEAKVSAAAKGISKILVSLSHSEVSCSCIYPTTDTDCLYRLLLLHLPKHRNDPAFFSLLPSFISSHPFA